jgi:glycerol kinase
MTPDCILVIDAGTTSTRAVVFDRAFSPVSLAQNEFTQFFPATDRVEHDADEIWEKTIDACRASIAKAGGVGRIGAIAIANQRETSVLWERAGGAVLSRAIVWQDRRGAARCAELVETGKAQEIQERTGLVVDSYFSATKLEWLLNNIPNARTRAARGELAFGTIDTFLVARLTGGASHVTDATNAARTLLYDIAAGRFDPWLCDLFGVSPSLLPEVRDSSSDFGATRADLFGRAIPILGVAGDQQAALVGQACVSPGQAKATYGTGCFLVANAGAHPPRSRNRLLATVGYAIGGRASYALEGSIFNAGTVVKWMRDDLHFFTNAAETAALAASLAGNDGVYIVPAFTGLGAPHWRADARGVIIGLTRATSPAHLVRAGLEAAVYQTADLLAALAADGVTVRALRVDGGMAANDWFLQFLADYCDVTVERPPIEEMTALGAAYLAGLQLGWIHDVAELETIHRVARRYEPRMSPTERAHLKAGWDRAIAATLAATGTG